MLTLAQMLSRRDIVAERWPVIPGLEPLYSDRIGFQPRAGQLMMIGGRSGSQKSGLALYIAAQLGWPTVYFAGDMGVASVVSRLGSAACNTPVVPGTTKDPFAHVSPAQKEAMKRYDHVRFKFGSPITYNVIACELNAQIAVTGRLPRLIVIDNLQDIAGDSYEEQMQAMSALKELTTTTGVGVIVLHHASDKSWDANKKPYLPPSRSELKNGVSERPEITLSIALDPHEIDEGINFVRVAQVKNRDGRCDLSGDTYAELFLRPDVGLFYGTLESARASKSQGVVV